MGCLISSFLCLCFSFSLNLSFICSFIDSLLCVTIHLLFSVVSSAFKSVVVTSRMNPVSRRALVMSSEVEEDRTCHFKLVDMKRNTEIWDISGVCY